MQHTIYIYTDQDEQWRWRRIGEHNDIVVYTSQSGEAYTNHNAAIHAAQQMNSEHYTLSIEELVIFGDGS